MYAAGAGHYNISYRLIELGANVNTRDGEGRTALMYAAGGGHVVVGRLLVAAGAGVTDKDDEGKTAFDIARDNGEFVMADFLGGPGDADAGNAEDLAARMEDAYNKGRYAEALAAGEKRRELLVNALGPEHLSVAAAENDLAVISEAGGDKARAEKYYKSALAIRGRALGPDNPVTAESVNNLAAFYYKGGDFKSASELFGQALKIQESSLGPSAPATLRTMENLALTHEASGERAKADKLRARLNMAKKSAVNAASAAEAAAPVYQQAKAAGTTGLVGTREATYPAGGTSNDVWKNMPDAANIYKAAGALALFLVAGLIIYKTRAIPRLLAYSPLKEKRAREKFDQKQCYEQAVAAETAKDFETSARLFEQLLEEDPHHHLARFKLARVYQYGMANPIKARKHYEILCRMVPVGHAFYREASESIHLIDRGY